MRIIAVIPHYYHPANVEAGEHAWHGSTGPMRGARVEALTACIAALHQLYGRKQCLINLKDRVTRPANTITGAEVTVVVCTTLGRHVLGDVDLAEVPFSHHPTAAAPGLLGFEAQGFLRDCIGGYDYYCYLEDDIIACDPWMFLKLGWFTEKVGDGSLLQPNRFEVGRYGVSLKAYVDGDLPRELVEPFQDLNEAPTIHVDILNQRIVLERPLNPHSGCYFLNDRQMRAWASRADFLDRATTFVGSLESAATLGIMRNFRIYKPAEQNAAFLEIQHHVTEFLNTLRVRES
jgi:hypothetical protein